ncbi:uncharacterized protein Z520_03738 [Fonsecaea multimorphosa CBS 102226]|uniref:Major facilitator superfamily (MFS) profile domain-containing protein n=1 Tax=Fonsecaea multimorphosa CBS 102226 TaxID=1442371 RepID=A0A0D2K2H8_9EURO|nr:uncharacterized protein Z520_03738 [Fonsecaea multimorphosa CBS 102226]KIY00053.1 hypothetical protein Z520_03738 [Fonsecaea multimorphosa CBS 102226]OAL27256.1 hypothetical protein AYO22_03531 [Fonsecaea multimorphosa]
MDSKETTQTETIEANDNPGQQQVDHSAFDPPAEHVGDLDAIEPINLSWRSWLVVFVAAFAALAQVYVVIAASTVITFIIRDLGDGPVAGWVIQGPLLMQSVLTPIVGRLSDVLDRRYLAAVPPLIAFAGAVVAAKASSMPMLIGGGILIGVTLSTNGIVQAIPSEVLPLKYRPLSTGIGYIAGTLGGLVAVLSAGALTNTKSGGWRAIFWIQAALHLASSLGFFLFYHPFHHSDFPKMTIRGYIWALDPIGSVLFIISVLFLLLALDWAGGTYAWSDAHVAGFLAIGFAFLILFCLYEWKGRSDGLVAHVFFERSPNFALATFAFTVEGWIFYSAVNSVTPQLILNLGFENNSWSIALRLLAFLLPAISISIPVMFYATKYKDLKSPLLLTFIVFLVVTILYSVITPSWSHAQIAMTLLAGIGQCGPLTLIIALVQFSAPHAYLSTATGLAFSARAIGGAFGSAVLDAIINGKLGNTWAPQVSAAAEKAGLPVSSVPALLEAFQAGTGFDNVKGLNSTILSEAKLASEWAYAHAYRLAWASIIPFVVLALIFIAFLKGVKELMTEKIEATVERVEGRGQEMTMGKA